MSSQIFMREGLTPHTQQTLGTNPAACSSHPPLAKRLLIFKAIT